MRGYGVFVGWATRSREMRDQVKGHGRYRDRRDIQSRDAIPEAESGTTTTESSLPHAFGAYL